VPEVVPSADESEGNQDQIGPRSGASTDNKAKPDVEKGPQKVAAKHKTQGDGTEIRAEAVASFQQ
jgi:hypothetical protein